LLLRPPFNRHRSPLAVPANGQGNPPVRGESGTGPTTFPLPPALLHLITDGAVDVRLDAHPLEIYAVDYVELVLQEACPADE